MMKNKILVLGFMTLFFASCSGFLEEKSQSEVIPRTATDFKELLLGSGYPYDEPANFIYFMDDDVELLLTATEAIGGSAANQYFPIYSWQPSLGDMDGLGFLITENPGNSVYYKYYDRIKGCNAVLDYIDTAMGSQEDRDRVKAEALAVRAFYYFQLVNIYGEPFNHAPDSPGVPLKLTPELTEKHLTRNTVREVYTQIVNDMKTASALLEPLPIIRRSYRLDQPALHILLSRVYLHMNNLEACVGEATKVIEKGGVLHDMTVSNPYPYSYESMAEIEWMFGASPQVSQGPYSLSPELLELFEQDKDRRYNDGISFPWNYPATYAIITKYSASGSFSQNLRTAEAYLNRAEANAMLGNISPAMKDLNDLRRHRIEGYVDEDITDKNALVDAIRLERRKEFFFEGFRWFDLRRYGMPELTHRYIAERGEAIVVYKLKEKDPMYTIPFPVSVLRRNPALTQNPAATTGERQPSN